MVCKCKVLNQPVGLFVEGWQSGATSRSATCSTVFWSRCHQEHQTEEPSATDNKPACSSSQPPVVRIFTRFFQWSPELIGLLWNEPGRRSGNEKQKQLWEEPAEQKEEASCKEPTAEARVTHCFQKLGAFSLGKQHRGLFLLFLCGQHCFALVSTVYCNNSMKAL